MMPSYKLMMEPHKIVHDRIRDNMTFIEPVDRVLENQEKLKQNFIEAEAASDELFKLMNAVLSEYQANHAK